MIEVPERSGRTDRTAAMPTIAGLFVGGASRRMGGAPKGLLPAADGSGALLQRIERLCRDAGLHPVLVGRSPAVEAALPHVEVLDDRPAGIGPLGGLGALLHRARGGSAIMLACDLPALDAALLRRLAGSTSHALLAPRDPAGRWQPFFSRWDADTALPWVEEAIAAGERSLQRLFDRRAAVLELRPDEWRALRDWDTPADVAAG